MSLSRRFLNLIVGNRAPGVKSLRRINLTRIFHPTPPPNIDGTESAAREQDAISGPPELKMETIRLPSPTFSFRASASAVNDEWKMDCFPLADCKVICADQSGRGFLFDANTRRVGTMPILHKPKVMPISLFVPKADVDDDIYNDGNGSSLFLMERIPKPEASYSAQQSDQFEAFIYRKPSVVCGLKSWHCHLLPPPPFVRETCNWNNNSPQITSYTVLGGGSHICISVKGVGTYCLDIKNQTWSEVGKWTLPFHGNVEYVPEFKLWFGLSAEGRHLAAADLSSMDSQPKLVGPWKELNTPEEWKECKDSQFVNLGSGRFCILRFFETTKTKDVYFGDELMDRNFAVFTGLQVVNRNCNGKVELGMVPHKSGRVNGTSIEALF